jgi:hypothetical protein
MLLNFAGSSVSRQQIQDLILPAVSKYVQERATGTTSRYNKEENVHKNDNNEMISNFTNLFKPRR